MARYSPGDWYAVVTPTGWALLPTSVPASAVEEIWTQLREGQGLGAVIDVLVGAFGTGLSRLPDFGVLTHDDQANVRVTLRGVVEARLWHGEAAEPTLVAGHGVTTWNERSLTDVVTAELLVAGSTSPDTLPVADGVVRAAGLAVAITRLPGGEDLRSVTSVDMAGAQPPSPWDGPVARSADQVPPPAVHPAEPAPALVVEEVAPEPPLESLVETPPGPGAGVSGLQVAPTPEGPTEPEGAAAPAMEVPVEPRGSAETTVFPDSVLLSDASVPPRDDATVSPEEAPNDYDRLLFGETVMSSVEAAAVRPVEPEGIGDLPTPPSAPAPNPAVPAPWQPPGPPPPPLPGMIAGLPSFVPPPPPPPPSPSPTQPWADHGGDTVLVQQLFPTPASTPGQAAAPPPPPTHPVLIVTGRPPVRLDRSAIVGTRPRLSRVQEGNVPHLVTVDSPRGEISRSHVELRLEGSTVLAVDLNSTNGTMLLRAGMDPVRLQPGEPTMLVPGDRLDLGEGVELSFEGLA